MSIKKRPEVIEAKGELSQKEHEIMCDKVSQVILDGGLCIVPTETVYGIAGNVRLNEAYKKIFDIKKREKGKPLTWHIGDTSQISFPINNPFFDALTKAFWPGPLSVVVPHDSLGSVGLRYPSHEVFQTLSRAIGDPMFVSSANFSGEKSATSLEDIPKEIVEQVDLLVDSGTCSVGLDSTVVDLRGERIRILREGALSLDDLNRAIENHS